MNEEDPFRDGLKLEHPYTVPDGYFDELQKELMTRVGMEERLPRRISPANRYRVLYAAAAIFLLATTGTVLYFTLRPSTSPVLVSAGITVDDIEAAGLLDELNESSIIEQVIVSTDRAFSGNESPTNSSSMLDGLSTEEIIEYLLETNDIESLTYEL